MEALKLEFAFTGRTTRTIYWDAMLIAMIGCGGAFLVFVIAIAALGASDLAAIGLGIISLTFLALLAAKAVQRLHDRNRSGAWFILFVLAPVVLEDLTRGSLDAAPALTGLLASALNFAAVVLFVWGQIELGFLRGARGANRFGDDPLRPGDEILA